MPKRVLVLEVVGFLGATHLLGTELWYDVDCTIFRKIV